MESIEELEEQVIRFQAYVDALQVSGHPWYHDENRKLFSMKQLLKEKRHELSPVWHYEEGCLCKRCRETPEYALWTEQVEQFVRGKSSAKILLFRELMKAMLSAGMQFTVVDIEEKKDHE